MPLTIVVADDTPDYRQIVRYLLAPLADTMTIVGEAADGEEALALVRFHRPDLVITDLIMPRLNGVELTKQIRRELPETRIILISSYTEDAYRLMASDSGADVFVSKRVIHDALLPAIRDLIRRISGGSGPLPPTITGGSSASAVFPKSPSVSPHIRAQADQIVGVPVDSAPARKGGAALTRLTGERGRAERAYRRSQKPPTKSSLYHEPPLRSQITLNSSWV